MMTNERFVRQLIGPHRLAILAVMSALSVFGEQPSSASIDPVIYLGTEHGGAIVHDRTLPLLLRVRLGNPVAANVRLQNQVASQQPERIEDDKSGNAQSQATPANRLSSPVPALTIASADASSLLSFEIHDASGKPTNLSVRPLPATQVQSGALILDGAENPVFYYGIDEAELSKLPPGKYSVSAVLSRPAQSGKWSGSVQSGPVTVDLRSGGLSTAERLVDVHQAGRFYLHGHNYPMVEKEAGILLELDKFSVSAWDLRGDAFLDQGKLDDAEKAFREALRNAERGSQSNIPQPLREPPEWLYQKLDKVRKLHQGAP